MGGNNTKEQQQPAQQQQRSDTIQQQFQTVTNINKKTEVTEQIDPELKQMNDEMAEAFGIMLKAIEELDKKVQELEQIQQ